MVPLKKLIRVTLYCGIVAIAFMLSAATATPMRDGYEWHGFDGNPSGLTDLEGKQILPAIYANIHYVGNGIFVATDISKADPFRWGEHHIFNKQGKELPYKVPDGGVFVDVFSLGNDADKDLTKTCDEFPKGSLLRYRTSFENGLCTPEGKVFTPLLPGVICFIKPGLGYSSPKDSNNPNKPNQFIDLQTGKLAEDKNNAGPDWLTNRTNYKEDAKLNPNYRHPQIAPYVVPFQTEKNISYRKISEDTLVKTVDIDDRQFHRDYWQEHRDSPVTRFVMFNRFLKQYDLIGMDQDQVLKLLGPGDSGPICGPGIEYDGYKGDIAFISQSLGGGGCMPQLNMRFCIHFSQGKVDHWNFAYYKQSKTANGRYVAGFDESPPIKTNVVIPSAEASDHKGRLVAGRIGEMPERFPKVVLK